MISYAVFYKKEGLAGPSHHHYTAKLVKTAVLCKCLPFFYCSSANIVIFAIKSTGIASENTFF